MAEYGRTKKLLSRRPWKEAIERALTAREECEGSGQRTLEQLARYLIECALDPASEHYQFAIKEIGLRVEGKPVEHHKLTSDRASTEALQGLSATLQLLANFGRNPETIDITPVSEDRPLLPAQIPVKPS